MSIMKVCENVMLLREKGDISILWGHEDEVTLPMKKGHSSALWPCKAAPRMITTKPPSYCCTPY
jgi:hypothetical protein